MPIRKYTLEQRYFTFWNRVIIAANDDLCWEWQGSKDKKGYGRIRYNQKLILVHRLAWQYPNYIIPDGMEVCHSCDHPNCCNPKHLFLGTHKENMNDMIMKRRDLKANGERHGSCKLTELQVLNIRRRYRFDNASQKELADEFGVKQNTISSIVNYVTWKNTI